MPVKFQKSAKTVKRGSKIVTVEHHYIKNQSKEDLIKYINEGQKPKIKQKCRNELDRRGIKLEWVTKES
ncbi:hypothetical protein N8955_00480 [bacterium]|jgi:hypothetical protein|nr:hypothetical protein [Hellea sp.]MDA7807192.1 hypothetical protein [bacterium]MDA9047817.1 hypothetical protein [Hellea sp.]MDA9225458.1 hypothetical protein [bacterium]